MENIDKAGNDKITDEDKKHVLAIAGNPKNGLVIPVKSAPGTYRILSRTYFYKRKIKRGSEHRSTIGYVVGDTFYLPEAYKDKFTLHGRMRPVTTPVSTAVSTTFTKLDIEALGLTHRYLGAVPILYETAKRSELYNHLILAYKNETFVKELVSIACHWLIEEDNVASAYAPFASQFALPFLSPLTEEEIRAIYKGLALNTVSLSQLFALRGSTIADDDYLGLDSTSITTAAKDNEQARISKTKDGTFEPMIHFAVVFSQKTKRPVLFKTFPGHLNDLTSVPDIAKRVEELLPSGVPFVLVMDRGYYSEETFRTLSQLNRRCLIAAKGIKRGWLSDEVDKLTDMWDAETTLPGCGGIHGKTVAVTHHGISLWVHIYRDCAMEGRQEEALEQELSAFEKLWKKEKAKCSTSQTAKYFDAAELEKGKAVRDINAISAEKRYFGFFANVTNYETTALKAYREYGQRDAVEKCFRGGKQEISLNVPRSHMNDTTNGRFVIAFIALSILSELQYQLGLERTFKDRRKKSIPANTYTFKDVIRLTRGVQVDAARMTKQFWLSGKANEVDRIALCCGCEGAYNQVPDYVTNFEDLLRV